MARLTLCAVALLVTMACSSAQPTEAPTELRNNIEQKRFLALGDSYAIGQGVNSSDRWPVQLVKRLRAEGFNIDDPLIIARTGWTTGELSRAIDAADPDGPYDLVTLLIGVNNQFRGEGIENYRTEFSALLRRAIEFADDMPSRVIVLSIPDWSVTPFAEGRDRATIAADIDQFNQVNRETAASSGATYIDITGVSRQAETDLKLLAGDRLHPSGAMYQAWAELLLPLVRTILK